MASFNPDEMATDEIIVELRKAYDSQPLWTLLKAAADRLEELDRRVEAPQEAAYPRRPDGAPVFRADFGGLSNDRLFMQQVP